MATLFSDLTPEQRAANLALAQKKRKERELEFKSKAHLLKQDFSTARFWEDMLQTINKRLSDPDAKGFIPPKEIRLPARYIPGTELKHARRALKSTGLTAQDVFGKRLKDFVADNPSWPAWAVAALIYETKEFYAQ